MPESAILMVAVFVVHVRVKDKGLLSRGIQVEGISTGNVVKAVGIVSD